MANFSICEELGKMMRITGELGTLVTAKGDNVMTIGWCLSGVMWGSPYVAVPVRQTRYTHDLLEAHGEFTLYAPTQSFSKQIGFCGTKSGRDVDKIAELGLAMGLSDYVDAPMVLEPGFVAHCKTLFKTDYSKVNMADEIYEKWYTGGINQDNFHTLYFAQVVAVTQN